MLMEYLLEKRRNLIKIQWYQCDLHAIADHDLAARFIQLSPDEDTVQFLQRCDEKSQWIPTQIWHSIAKGLMGFFMTQTSINGWLERGSMFVLSLMQFFKLLRFSTDEETSNWRRESLLDLGAGDGAVTARLAPIFQNIYVTEMSTIMRSLLVKRDFHVLNVDDWHESTGKLFDVITCLNLLDRCDRPLDLLARIRTSLTPTGLLLLAIVLPFSPYVEEAITANHKPSEPLPIKGDSFEDQLHSLVVDVLEPAGFQVYSWSRLPYLCEGDLKQSFYWLDDAILALTINNN